MASVAEWWWRPKNDVYTTIRSAMTSSIQWLVACRPQQAFPRRVEMKNCPFAGLKKHRRRGRRTTWNFTTPPIWNRDNETYQESRDMTTINKYYQIWRKHQREPRQAVLGNKLSNDFLCIRYIRQKNRFDSFSDISSNDLRLIFRCRPRGSHLRIHRGSTPRLPPWNLFFLASREGQRFRKRGCRIADPHTDVVADHAQRTNYILFHVGISTCLDVTAWRILLRMP
jgi:hypothetical protein